MKPKNILIVEDDITFQLMLKKILSDYTLTVVDSGEAAIEAVSTETPDMAILDINLPGIDGYETCQNLRALEQTSAIPIIFLSSFTELDDRLHAYGVGGNDYISKPFDVNELRAKIELHSNAFEKQQNVEQELKSHHGLLMSLQTSSAKLQSISRFIQATLFCHDVDALFKHFFKTAQDIDLKCVLSINSHSGVETRASNGVISTLEQEILTMSSKVERIHSFGKDRAIFRWSQATLLTNNLGDMIDTLAILMDALEAGIKSVDTESRLLQQVEELELNNDQLRDRITHLFREMNGDINLTIAEFSVVSELDSNDQDKLTDILDNYMQRIDSELDILNQNNKVVTKLINELRIPPPELQNLMEESSDSSDAVELF